MTAVRKTGAKEKRTPIPLAVKPMLCTLLKKPFIDPAYLFEIKWDGYRVIAYKNDGLMRLVSRGGQDYTKKYPPIANALEKLSHKVVLDGEVVVINAAGKPDFDALQKFNGQKSGVLFYVFDILWLDGRDLMNLPLLERKAILKETVGDNPIIRYSDHFDDGMELFRHAEALKLEGIIAKQKASRYIPDRRGREWYKIPTEVKDEFVIGGWVESESRLFRTLLFGAYEGKELRWIGHAGGGFKDREMKDIHDRLRKIETKKRPFVNEVDYDGAVHWVKPELVANIKFATFTRSGKIRKPAIFLGFREDKPAGEVLLKDHLPDSVHTNTLKANTRPVVSEESNWKEVDAEALRNEDQLEVEECSVRVYNVDRELWKGVTKAHLIQYYHTIGQYLLPHVKDRPLSLYLKLKGAHAAGVYIKDMEGRQPDCSSVFTTSRKHPKPGKRDVIDYLLCNNMATLLYIINLGCIDVNPWTSRTATPTKPDYIVIDLDPSDKDFAKVITAARAAKELFDEHQLKAFPKTSGKTGMHLYIPCAAFTFAQARGIAEYICREIHSLVPDFTTTEVTILDRGTRLYLDPNQNDFADTVASPYSVRPAGRPTVSTPLEWREVNEHLDPHDFTIQSIHQRLEKKGDLFAPVLDRKIAAANDRRLKRLAI